MDAISFVLGVNSSHLRSQNLKDMIYRSEALSNDEISRSSRAPRQAAVTAVYQDNKGQEIRFKRTIDDSGKSDYSINDRIVQYSRYNSSLEKENILVKAKNFLVFQGDVESVASQSPKDLTRLIEQISGSWDYKDAYEKAKTEMEHAAENSAHTFVKKRGLIGEIKQYEAQKKEAEKFEEKVKDRRECILQYLLWKLYHLELKSNNMTAEKDQKYFASTEAKNQQDSLEYQFKTARENKALLHREKTRLEVQIRRVQKELEDQLPNSIKSKEKLISFEKKIKQTQFNIERIKGDGQQQESLVHSLERDIQLLSASESQLKDSELAASSQEVPQLTLSQAKDYERRKEDVNNKAAEDQQQLYQLQRQHKTQKQRTNEQQAKVESLEESEAETIQKIKDTEAEIAIITTEGEKATEKLQSRQTELSNLVEERESVHRHEVALNEKLQKVLSQLLDANLTLQDNENDSKFNDSLATMKQIYPNVYGKLSDLCRPSQRKYDNAIATVFGKNMEAIVVEDETTAIECIRHMKEQRIPSATFLPLHSLSVPSNNQFNNLIKGARHAFDLVKFDPQYDQVIRYVCGNTVVCDNINIARTICFDMNQSVRAVTLDGTVIHPNGLMTGGSAPTQPVTRWHESEVEELMQKRDAYLAELNEVSLNKRMGSLEDSVRNDHARLQALVDSLNDDLTAARRKIEGLNGTLEDIRSKISLAKLPLTDGTLQTQQLDQKIAEVRARIADVEDQVFEDFCAHINVANIREYEAKVQNGSDEVSERRAQFLSQKKRLDTQLEFEKEQLNELVSRLQSLENSLAADTSSKSQIEKELNGMGGRKEQLIVKLEKCKQESAAKGKEEEEKQKEITELISILEAQGRNVKQIVKEVGAIETDISKCHAERVAIFRKCKLEGINLPMNQGSMDDVVVEGEDITQSEGMMTDDSSISSSMDVDEPPSQVSILTSDWTIEINYAQVSEKQRKDNSQATDKKFQDEIKRLADEIDQMAPNLKAVDRLESVEESLKTADDEFNAARSAAKTTKEKFATIKQKRHSLFFNAFSHISEHIDRVYKDLTKSDTFPLGGTAYLSLEDSDEPYSEGIKYHAMPPMKRFRDMEQLSGGEKSVAALALLFAIHSYKPSPFFVLDEVDAALDNLNVSTVASYIRQHATDQFQFIVISLKQLLYEKAQSLVGIYRDQEHNTSKTMTLMLDQYQE
ncbi:hypothetical protein BY458DRAFT_446081 [Sporodiniella umbellata]|nr:hypothetical protein BY458DRAFT_446081 [Sporodiniella umbellata]